MIKGKLIAIHGVDGSGKTTQARFLSKYFDEKGLNVFHLPKIPSFAGWIVDCLNEEYPNFSHLDADIINILEASDRIRNLLNFSEKMLNYKNTILISEGYTPSYIARAIVQGCSKNTIHTLEYLYKACVVPDISIYLEIELDVAAKRIEERGYDNETKEYLRKLDVAYKSIKNYEGFHIINTNKKTAYEVHYEIVNLIKESIK